MALMWSPTRAFRFFDSKPKWHKWHKSMRNQWAHQSQNENLFSQFLARKKKKKRCKFLVSTGVMLIPGLHGGFVISKSAQRSCCHATSKWSWLLSHQPGQEAELSLIHLLSRPSLHHTETSLLDSLSLTPKWAWESLESFQGKWREGPEDAKACFFLQGTKTSLCLVYQRVLKSCLKHNL